jgi:hypothetical protein
LSSAGAFARLGHCLLGPPVTRAGGHAGGRQANQPAGRLWPAFTTLGRCGFPDRRARSAARLFPRPTNHLTNHLNCQMANHWRFRIIASKMTRHWRATSVSLCLVASACSRMRLRVATRVGCGWKLAGWPSATLAHLPRSAPCLCLAFQRPWEQVQSGKSWSGAATSKKRRPRPGQDGRGRVTWPVVDAVRQGSVAF